MSNKRSQSQVIDVSCFVQVADTLLRFNVPCEINIRTKRRTFHKLKMDDGAGIGVLVIRLDLLDSEAAEVTMATSTA